MNELRDVFTKYKAVVFFDTETTGLEAESCQIIELAAIRVEKTERGTLRMADSADVFVKLPEGERIPQKIVELTGITDEQLENEGITEAEAAARFTELISGGRVLLVAHNAQFDLLFTAEMLRRHGNGGPEALKAADYLDSLTVYKDRRVYPHKLANAILTYKLEDKVQNSHRAIDDVAALFEVCKAMDAERSDLLSYVNVFGYNPKYGVTSNAEAARFAKGLLRNANKFARSGYFSKSLMTGYAAASILTLSTPRATMWDGTVFVYKVRHDFVGNKSTIYFRHILEGY